MTKGNNDKRCLLLGENIKKIRNKKGWSQDLLSEKADIHVSYIGQIERGLRFPSLKTLFKISDSLGVNISEIFEGLNARQNSKKNK